jgi:hydroxymethylpyrimidine/phosphomethylpyrimidine kinase
MAQSELNQSTVLTIAGSDPSGGAGIQADLKSIMANGGYGMAIPTILTAQNTHGIETIFSIPPDHIRQQLRVLFSDIVPRAIKIGALGTVDILKEIIEELQDYRGHIVWDPILYSTSGTPLISTEAISLAVSDLLPLCNLITPNHFEYQNLFTRTDLHTPCLLTNGDSNDAIITDVLLQHNQSEVRFTHPRHETSNTHGTGCTLSSSIATYLSRGYSLEQSCLFGIEYTQSLIAKSASHSIGSGNGSLYHEQHIKPFRS